MGFERAGVRRILLVNERGPEELAVSQIHPILPGYYCVPSTLMALTGAEPTAVVPVDRRHDRNASLTDNVAGVGLTAAEAVLAELGYAVRRYRKPDARALLRTWAERSKKYLGRNLLVCTAGGRKTPGHALVLRDGRIYDNHTPVGSAGPAHPFAVCVVDYVALVEKRT